jgi:hypothetical protein
VATRQIEFILLLAGILYNFGIGAEDLIVYSDESPIASAVLLT